LLTRTLSVLLLACSFLFGQATTSLRGLITDTQGASIGDAVVTLTDPATGALRKGVSSATGEYQFLQLAPGTYSVKVEKPGFTVLIKNDLVLSVNTPATLDCKLELGSVGTTVSVEADAASINTVNATVGNAFGETQIRQLPLQTRNVVELLSIQPGVTQTGEVLGARRDQNNITLDGVDVNYNQNSGITNTTVGANGSAATSNTTGTAGFNSALPVPLDSVQEFRVTIGGTEASQGRSSGGQVSLITKSGTNVFHGSFYEYNRNTLLAANDWFSNKSGLARAPLVRNQFGASLGGPVIKNRVFFFGNWERRIDASATATTRTVPSESLKQGILTFKLTNGSTQTLSPAELLAIDPLHQGFSAAMKSYLNAYPVGNDPTLGADKGLNFSGLRFNAPKTEDDSAYVAKMDFNIDTARKHTVAVRGTLNGASQVNTVAQFPGQSPASLLLNNSKGISANYTWVVNPSMINVATFGLTRLGLQQSGALGTSLSFDSISSPTSFTPRPSIQILPTYNLADDFTWTKGTHTITSGINFRFVKNKRLSYSNSFASYSYSRNTLLGLGGDATTLVTSAIQAKLGDSSAKLADTTSVQRALGDIFGLINQYSANYQFNTDGSVVPFGSPSQREYAANEYESYVQDSWRVRRDLTLTLGLRYSNYASPYETSGNQVGTTVPLETYFAERIGAMNAGLPAYSIPDASLTYQLNGPVNGKSSWFNRDKNNFGPRAAFAYAPESNSGNWWSKILGKGSVLRGGAGMVYDRYGSDLVYYIDNSGSPGLASNVTQPVNTDLTTSVRYSGPASLPTLPAAPSVSYPKPFTPATITGGFNSGVGVASGLKAPYSFVMNLNYAHQLPGKLTVEIGYAGRLARKNLIQQDYDQPATLFKDQASGQTWANASGVLRDSYNAGANINSIQPVAFFENQFPGLKNAYVPGSATQNYYYALYTTNAGSDLDTLNQMDRLRTTQFPKCVSKTGCNTFYPLQYAGLPTWTNNGFSNYHAGTLTLRRALSNGFSFDFNYTLSHSIDNSSGAESGAGSSGAILQDAFNPNSFRGSSDFDQRHNITANVLYELPVGKGKKFAGSAPMWLDEIVGGWQVTSLFRYHSGQPTTITDSGYYPTNYLNSALAIRAPGSNVQTSYGIDSNGLPSIFASPAAVSGFIEQYPGQTGTRAIVRLPGYHNFDIAIAKSFRMPWEGHRLQFRAEGFNAFNNVNFYAPSLSIASPAKFGELASVYPARVIQLSLRYQF
jgi:hypothetical protein